MKFKVGDLVLCVDGNEDNLGLNPLTPGSIHKVLALGRYDTSIEIDNNNLPNHYSFLGKRFIKIDKELKLFRLIYE